MKKCFLIFFFAMVSLPFLAQNLDYSGVTRFSGRGVGPIISGNELTGYFTYFMVEKQDKKNNVFQVDIANTNLEKVGSFEVVRPKTSVVLEVVFNGKYFMFTSYIREKGGSMEYTIYDINGEVQGSYQFGDLCRLETYYLQMKLDQPEVDNISTYSLGESGFLKYNVVDVGKNGYLLEAIDNSGQKMWSYGSVAKAPTHENADVLSADENFVAIYLGKKKNAIGGGPAEYSLVVLDAKTGQELFVDDLEQNGNQLSLLNCFFEKENNSVLLIGEMYKPGDEPLKDQGVGIFIKELTLDGTEKKMNQYLWAKEINNAKKAKLTEEQKESEDKSAIFVHKVIRGKDGTLTLIGEQYKKTVSALGTASAVLSQGQGASAFKMVVMNMVVMQFGSDMAIKDYRIVTKGRSNVLLPGGYGVLPPATLASYIKMTGGFDYVYTSADKAKDKFSVIYLDSNRKDEGQKEKNDVMIGAMHFKDNEMLTNRNPINTEASSFFIKAAKPGYVMVTEYFKKEKRLKTRLESMKE